ncbi:sulfotransferase family protein [Motilimonas pumila]|uniref:Sulfotransferase family protein n=1 Tax=Motilimonas pumila TaxID=2303987 RepID=A0A418Y9T0_9GAMM|nr:sulfotransferase family protein [Motilimonas pumila]RJG38165.1 sulfotransferase family protein [Motilimonas pumila]
MQTNKVFIIGLPRTATTSVCQATVQLGFTTAHTAYTQATFEQAQVIADTPIFCDYQHLDKQYPGAKFIYLERAPERWLPSIRQLLNRMLPNLQRNDGGFNPVIKRCYNQVFWPLNQQNLACDDFLLACYQRHYQEARQYFASREKDLLCIDVAKADSFGRLLTFLGVTDATVTEFEHINRGGKVTAWKQVKSPLKIASTRNGRVDGVS